MSKRMRLAKSSARSKPPSTATSKQFVDGGAKQGGLVGEGNHRARHGPPQQRVPLALEVERHVRHDVNCRREIDAIAVPEAGPGCQDAEMMEGGVAQNPRGVAMARDRPAAGAGMP